MDSADADEKDRTSTLIPATQQLGFALDAALSGLIANGLGLSTALSPERLKVVTVWLFIGFLPCALAGIVLVHPANDDCGAGGVWGCRDEAGECNRLDASGGGCHEMIVV